LLNVVKFMDTVKEEQGFAKHSYEKQNHSDY
jgi:hypothetical protein